MSSSIELALRTDSIALFTQIVEEKKSVSIAYRSKNDETLLHLAAKYGAVTIALYLLIHRYADAQKMNKTNETPLSWAKRSEKTAARGFMVSILQHAMSSHGKEGLEKVKEVYKQYLSRVGIYLLHLRSFSTLCVFLLAF